uniref:Uncharacterized protein n=1 Tax=Nelumbo nucifera TaxID=4432 RepID=A0A822YTU2_NELNU|nr:TPA_asm: hypothetical protein HUJ06_004836 [Nelumbo nucifera]
MHFHLYLCSIKLQLMKQLIFKVKGVSYRPSGTQHNLLNEVNFSLPEKRYMRISDLITSYFIFLKTCLSPCQVDCK